MSDIVDKVKLPGPNASQREIDAWRRSMTERVNKTETVTMVVDPVTGDRSWENLQATYIPYTGANANADLGLFGLTGEYLTAKSTATSGKLKAEGSAVDAGGYYAKTEYRHTGNDYWYLGLHTVYSSDHAMLFEHRDNENNFLGAPLILNLFGAGFGTLTPKYAADVGGTGLRVRTGSSILLGGTGVGDYTGSLASSTGGGTFTGNLTVSGTLTSGLINGQTISSTANFTGSVNVATAMTAGTINDMTLIALATGFSIAGGTISKTLTLNGNAALNQNVESTSAPTFAGLTLTGDLNFNTADPWITTTSSPLTFVPFAGQDFVVSLSSTGDFIVNTKQLFVDSSASFVGIGTATPASKLHVLKQVNGTYALQLDDYDTDATGPGIKLSKIRGTTAAPTAVLSGDSIGDIDYFSMGASTIAKCAAFSLHASQNHSETARGTYFTLDTTADNSTTSTERVRVNQTGYVGIGSTNPLEYLHIKNETTAGMRRIAKFEHGSPAVDGNGVYLEFASSATDGFGAQIGGVRQATGGLGALVIRTGAAAQVERLRVTNEGLVGIGTSTPSQLFSVGATSQFTVDASGNVSGGTLTSGLINGQTISATANFTGTVGIATSITVPEISILGGAATAAHLDLRGFEDADANYVRIRMRALGTATLGGFINTIVNDGASDVAWVMAHTLNDVPNGPYIAVYANGDMEMSGNLGLAGTRVPKGWFTNLEVTNTITGSITGTAAKATDLVGGNNTTLLGAIPYQQNIDDTALLSPNTTTTKKFLRQTGDGTNGAAPAWDTVAVGDVTGLGANVATWLATPSSANLAAAMTDETGSGALVFATSPTLTTPIVTSLEVVATTKTGLPAYDIGLTTGHDIKWRNNADSNWAGSMIRGGSTASNYLDFITGGASSGFRFFDSDGGTNLFNIAGNGALTITGAIGAGSNTLTVGLINGQTISSTASFTGTVAIATSLTVDSATVSSTTIGNWNTAYGWGNHAGLYDLLGAASTVQGNLNTHAGLDVSTSAVHGLQTAGLATSYLDATGNYSTPIGTTYDLSGYALLASPTFTGTVTLPKVNFLTGAGENIIDFGTLTNGDGIRLGQVDPGIGATHKYYGLNDLGGAGSWAGGCWMDIVGDNTGNYGIRWQTQNYGVGNPVMELSYAGNLSIPGTLGVTGAITGSNLSGTNTGDNATNTQYSGLAASKADVGQTFYIGTTQVAINRGSATLNLTGIGTFYPSGKIVLPNNIDIRGINNYASERSMLYMSTSGVVTIAGDADAVDLKGATTVTGSLTVTTGFGCNSKTSQGAYTVNAASTDLATVVALCNQLRAALVANGICI